MYYEAYSQLNSERQHWSTEEEVRLGWIHVLRNELHVSFHAERGRSDADCNKVIIEFKDKGLFHKKDNSLKFREAIYDRLAKYIPEKAKHDGCNASQYIGIAIDGDSIAFAYFPTGTSNIVHGPIMPLSLASVSLVFDTCKNSLRRSLTSENLIEDFGHGSTIGRCLMQALCNSLVRYLNMPENNKIKMLFSEWKSLYGQVADLSTTQMESVVNSIGFICENNIQDVLSVVLFVINTFNSLIIKLLSAEIVSKITSLTSYSDFSQVAVALNNDNLLHILDNDIEHSELYSRAHIHGFVEEPLFSWYIDVCMQNNGSKEAGDLIDLIREVLIKLSSYQIVDLSMAQTKDVLKCFYQNLVPQVLRKSLGEFYTPDWLVEVVLDKIDGNFVNMRFLDPTCGSGSFLIAIIKRIRNSVKLNSAEILKRIINNVWGFDLNPLAVQIARVNYLIAVSDLIMDNPGIDIELPILLADAIYSPSPDQCEDSKVINYTIGSSLANLTVSIPTILAEDRERLDSIFHIMSDCVELNYSSKRMLKEIGKRNLLCDEELNSWNESLSETYLRVLNLHRRNWNGIWFRIIKNYFWSTTTGAFDVVVGNPPWVRWSKLPELYRERVRPTCLKYDIFSHTPYHGGNELDISGLITYTVVDKWLKMSGQLLFLLTQTHFQSASSEGFRRFNIDNDSHLMPIEVDDLKALKPFPDAANKTAIFKAVKTKETPRYPIPYIVWDIKEGKSRVIPIDSNKKNVLSQTSRSKQEAVPVADIGSPWAICPTGEFSTYQKMRGTCSWVEGRKGITCDLNGIYYVNILSKSADGKLVQIETRPQAGRNDIGPKQRFWVEPDLIFPLIKGAGDLSCCGFNLHNIYAIVPNMGINNADYVKSCEEVEVKNPRLFEYLKTYETQLRLRSTYRTRMPKAPFYAVYNVGSYSFAPWKVVWAEQPGNCVFPVAVVNKSKMLDLGEKIIIPDHKIYFVEFDEAYPAYYLCGLLSCECVQKYIRSFNIMIQVGDIFKHMQLPPFKLNNKSHLRLSKLVKKAHSIEDNDVKKSLLNSISRLGNKILNDQI